MVKPPLAPSWAPLNPLTNGVRRGVTTRVLAVAALAVLAASWWGGRAKSDPGQPAPTRRAAASTTNVVNVVNAAPDATVYGPDPQDVWNRLHDAIFRRDDAPAGALDEDVPDPPLWHDTRHLLRVDAYARVLAALGDLAGRPRAELTRDPLRAAVMQHDLWAAFDWAAASRLDDLHEHRLELRGRLAAAIERLALTSDRIAALPDNMARVAAARDRGAGSSPPADLLRPDGPWVCVGRGAPPPATRPAEAEKAPEAPEAAGGDPPTALHHVRASGGRSTFSVFLNLPDGRSATEAYCRKINQVPQAARTGNDLPQFPAGTRVALVRRMLLIDADRRIRPAPLVETIQVRTFRALTHSPFEGQEMQEFLLRRRELFAGGAGLAAVGGKQQMYDYHNLRGGPIPDPIEGRGPRTDTPHLFDCGFCHIGAGIRSVNSFTGAEFAFRHRTDLWPCDPAAEVGPTTRWKTDRKEWDLLRQLMAEQAKAAP